MPASKIVDEGEVRRWFAEGLTYEEMSRRYLDWYHIETGPTLWANFRRRHGLPRRTARNTDLIPWDVRPEHRWHRVLTQLRHEGRRREGLPLREEDERRLDDFLATLARENSVVVYAPNTQEGFLLEPREVDDSDIIRRPTTRVSAQSRSRVS